jgi:hypothetical protein
VTPKQTEIAAARAERTCAPVGEGREFAVERQVIEARGLCATCRTGQRPA